MTLAPGIHLTKSKHFDFNMTLPSTKVNIFPGAGGEISQIQACGALLENLGCATWRASSWTPTSPSIRWEIEKNRKTIKEYKRHVLQLLQVQIPWLRQRPGPLRQLPGMVKHFALKPSSIIFLSPLFYLFTVKPLIHRSPMWIISHLRARWRRFSLFRLWLWQQGHGALATKRYCFYTG